MFQPNDIVKLRSSYLSMDEHSPRFKGQAEIVSVNGDRCVIRLRRPETSTIETSFGCLSLPNEILVKAMAR